MVNKEQLIIALDYQEMSKALQLVDDIQSAASYYKVGLELFLNSQGKIVDELKRRNKKIFLDLKFHDIPNTVAQACYWAAGLGVDMFNVHAGGGLEMMERAREAMLEGASKAGQSQPKLIAVTILTSFDQKGIQKIGYSGSVEENVERLAQLTYRAGLDGVVCSSLEVDLIKKVVPSQQFMTVCPGIRPSWAQKGDQKRVMTPSEAMEKGVSHIVVGRPVTQAQNPAEAARKILNEMGIVEE